MFDKIKFYKAAALLKSLRDNLPRGDIELNHVEDYHSFLPYLQEQIGADLSEFRIPPNAIKIRVPPYTKQYCDPVVFKRQIDALIRFIDTYRPVLEDPVSKPEETVIIDPPE